MQPTKLDPKPADDLWRARLSQQIDLRHPLVRLAGLIDWAVFEARFCKLYHPQLGRPGVPIRRMVGLSISSTPSRCPTKRNDGQTLAPARVQVERLTGATPERCYVDRGYRGHGVPPRSSSPAGGAG